MARTTPAAVQLILDSHYNGTTSLLPFIRPATAMVDWLVSKDADSELNDDLTAEIEGFLAAHLYEHADQQFQSKTTGKATATFKGQTAMVLTGTQYGQTAMLLDVTNRLSKRSKEAETGMRRVAKAYWLGTKQADDFTLTDGDGT